MIGPLLFRRLALGCALSEFQLGGTLMKPYGDEGNTSVRSTLSHSIAKWKEWLTSTAVQQSWSQRTKTVESEKVGSIELNRIHRKCLCRNALFTSTPKRLKHNFQSFHLISWLWLTQMNLQNEQLWRRIFLPQSVSNHEFYSLNVI